MRHTYATPIVLIVLLALAGCGGSSPATVQSAPRTPAPYLETTAVAGHKESVVDTALDWAERHAQLSEQLIQAHKENQHWEVQNRQLKTQAVELQGELEQTQEELTAANGMLVEFRSELSNWKKDVIGNRQEIEYQHKVEMEALYKILKFLGGEVPETPPVIAAAPATVAPAATTAPGATAAPASEELSSEAEK